MSAQSQYEESLVNYPGRGSGLHQHIMRVANLGVLAEIPHDEIIRDMDTSFDGIRRREAYDAVKKAAATSFDTEWKKPEIQKQDASALAHGEFTNSPDRITGQRRVFASEHAVPTG
jgi:hypothetical protein